MIMKTKYYLNGKLVRTSYNNYEYAITFNGRLIACCGDEAKAQKRFNSEVSYFINYKGYSPEECNTLFKIEKLQKVSA